MSTAIVVSDYDPLAVFDEIEYKLSTISNVEQAITIMDQADGLRRLVRRATQGFLAQNKYAYIKFLAQRRAGELLRDLPRAPIGGAQSGRGEKHSNTFGECLRELGIVGQSAWRWEQLATLPADRITDEWQKADATGQELTEKRVYARVREHMEGAERGADETEGDFYQRVWKGMPEFTRESTEPVQKIVVNLATREDVRQFETLLGQRLTDRTRSIWFPYKGRVDKKHGLVYVDDPPRNN